MLEDASILITWIQLVSDDHYQRLVRMCLELVGKVEVGHPGRQRSGLSWLRSDILEPPRQAYRGLSLTEWVRYVRPIVA